MIRAIVLLLILLPAAMSAQFLPDIERFEVENVRLILLDAQGKRRGILTGDLARKQRDGTVHIENAELRVERGVEAFVVKSSVFDYTPETRSFDCPEGLTADLPNGGYLQVPKGKGTLDYTNGVVFHMVVDGEARVRDGPEGSALVDAKITNPVIDASFKAVQVATVAGAPKADAFELVEIAIVGDRGGDCKLRLAGLPSVSENDATGPSVVSVSCFGDVSVKVRPDDAELHMLRRARMALDDGSFEVTSNLLDVRGQVVRRPKDKNDPHKREEKETAGQSLAATLADLEIDADQNVSITSVSRFDSETLKRTGTDFDGRCATLRYREFGVRREIRMEGEPWLNFDHGEDDEGAPVRLELRAGESIEVQVPDAGKGSSPAEVATELTGNATARRLLNARMEWQIAGRSVRLFSTLDEGAARQNVYNHSFDANATGYTPLLRVGSVSAGADSPGIQRASVFGSRSEGSYTSGNLFVRVFGPEVLGVVHSDAPLADMLKIALSLKEPPRDPQGRAQPPAHRDGRLTVRASTVLELGIATASEGDLSLAAQGDVQLDHQPVPRDDANLVTLSGSAIALEVRAGELMRALLEHSPQADAVATMGYDLLICRGLDMAREGDTLISSLSGPGRVVVRDKSSVAYFRQTLDRLPKRPNAPEAALPDAAWLDFGGSFRSSTAPLERVLEIEQPDFHLVDGDFEQARAGRTAVNDLDELVDPLVVLLYRIKGARAYATSRRSAAGRPPINVLRLEGDAYVDSRLDKFSASAAEAIELSGSENQSAEDSPFSAVLHVNARLLIEDAELFFGEYVRSGVFAYGGSWALESAQRLEITFRPIDSSGPEDRQARDALAHALQANRILPDRLHSLELAFALLRGLAAGKRPTIPGADQAWKALSEVEQAERNMRRALWLEMQRDPSYRLELVRAERSARRARALLSTLIDVAGSGGLRGQFQSPDTRVPALTLEMDEALFTFDGLGQIVDVSAEGPIVVSRDAYTIIGSTLRRGADGTLTLDGASITLPEDAGIDVTGVQSVTLKQSPDTGMGIQRTLVTRVSGKGLRVSVKLAPLED